MKMKAFRTLVVAILCASSLASCARKAAPAAASPSPSAGVPLSLRLEGASDPAEGSAALFAGTASLMAGTAGFRHAEPVSGGALLWGGSLGAYLPAEGEAVALSFPKPPRAFLGSIVRGAEDRALFLDGEGILAIDPASPEKASRLVLPADLPRGSLLAALGGEWIALASEEGSLAWFKAEDLSAGPFGKGLPRLSEIAWDGSELALLGQDGSLYLLSPSRPLSLGAEALSLPGKAVAMRGGPGGLVLGMEGGGSVFIPAGTRESLDIGRLSAWQRPRPASGGFVVRKEDGSLALTRSQVVEGAHAPLLDSLPFGIDPRQALAAREAGDSWLVSGDSDLCLRDAAGKLISSFALADVPLDAPFLSAGRLWCLCRGGLWRIGPARRDTEYLLPDAALEGILPSLASLSDLSSLTADEVEIQPYAEGLSLTPSARWRILAYPSADGRTATLSVEGEGRYLIAAFDEEGGPMGNNRDYETGGNMEMSLMGGKTYYFAYSPIGEAGGPSRLRVERGLR